MLRVPVRTGPRPAARRSAPGAPRRRRCGSPGCAPDRRARDLLAAPARQAEDAAVEQHRLVEVLPGLGEVDVVDPGQQRRGAGVSPPSNSGTQAASPARRPARNTSVPSGAAEGGQSCSLARVRRKTAGAWSARARGRRRGRVGDLEPDRGQRRLPVPRLLLVAGPPAPRPGSTAGPSLLRCRPRKVKPSWPSSTSTSPASSAFTSTKSKAAGRPTSGSRVGGSSYGRRSPSRARPGPPARSAIASPAGRSAARRSAGRCR